MRTIVCLLALVMALPPTFALAGDEAHVYDAQGRYQGRATTDTANPKQKSLYDAKGRYIGRVMTDDKGNARVYDQHGKYQGRVSGWQGKTSGK